MKRLSPLGFTLVEMVVVIAVVIALAALTISIAAYANRKANMTEAQSQIHTMKMWCEAYKNDNGTYPQNADTDALDPRLDVDPTSPKYQKASLHLYSCVTGDFLPAGAPDGKSENGHATYGTFPPKQLNTARSGAGAAGSIVFIQDPYGFAYGYSTAANQMETAYRSAVRSNPNAARPTALKGYSSTCDLWSTGGGSTAQQRAKWLKDWAE